MFTHVNELRLNNGFLFCICVLKDDIPVYQECTVVELRTGI